MNKIKLPASLFAVLAVAIACLGSASVFGQQTTERYIPIGKSPGISNAYSYIGEIVAVDAAAHTIVVDSNRGRQTIQVTTDTKIWLDKSRVKQTNTVGGYEDCEVGRRVEVMHVHEEENVAAWIKIEAQ